jgi:hypothetical protein
METFPRLRTKFPHRWESSDHIRCDCADIERKARAIDNSHALDTIGGRIGELTSEMTDD